MKIFLFFVILLIFGSSVVGIFYQANAEGSITSSVSTNMFSLGAIKHVIVIMEENSPLSAIQANASAPFENALMNDYASTSNYTGHAGSLSDYLMITSGDYYGCGPCGANSKAATNIGADLLTPAGLTWKSYLENMSSPCNFTNWGGYYVHSHNGFMIFKDVDGNQSYCKAHVIPFGNQLSGFFFDLKNNSLPTYSFLVPNACNDGEDPAGSWPGCPGNSTQMHRDQWLSKVVPVIMNSSEYASTILFITFDECACNHGIQLPVYSVIVSPFAKNNFTTSHAYNPYSFLATTENKLGLSNLGKNDKTATIMSDMFS